MTPNTEDNTFKMWAAGVVEQITTLRTHIDSGMSEIRSAILQLALTDAEVVRLREQADKLVIRVQALENSELVRTTQLKTIKALNKWMVGLMTATLISVLVALILNKMGLS